MRTSPTHVVRMRALGGLALACLLALTACSGPAPSDGSDTPGDESTYVAVPYNGPDSTLPHDFGEIPASTDLTIGYLGVGDSVAGPKALGDSVEAEVTRLGGTVIRKDPQFNLDTQISQFEQLLNQGVSAIVLFPLDSSAFGPSLEAAAASNVPVIVVDSPVDPGTELTEGYSAGVVLGRDYAAYLLANAVAATKPGTTFALIGVTVPFPALHYEMEALKRQAEAAGLVFAAQVDATDTTSDGVSRSMSTILAQHPDVGAVFTYNDLAAMAAAATARTNGNDEVLVSGLNGEKTAVDAILADRLFATYGIDFTELGATAAIGAIRAASGEDIPQVVSVLGTLVDATSAKTYKPTS